MFSFFANDDTLKVSFTCNLQSEQCIGLSSTTHKRCQRRTLKALPFCWQHTISNLNVVIKKSRINGAGMGLYACDPSKKAGEIVFRPGDLIAMYGGEHLTQKQIDKRYGSGKQTAPYAWAAPNGVIYDSACKRFIAAYANDHKNRKNNAILDMHYTKGKDLLRIKTYTHLPDKIPAAVATKIIRNGDEVYIDYGKDYWKGLSKRYNVHANTTGISKKDQHCRLKKK